MTEEHFIFPLSSVLFPGGTLPLKIFEQRYLEMTKACIRDGKPFGVCLIREGREVGEPAVPEDVGCLATIESWDMQQLGMFNLIARGAERFRLQETSIAKNGLITGMIERLPDEPTAGAPDRVCADVLKLIIDKVGESKFPAPRALDDPLWVSYRLAEVLPFEQPIKQELLEIPSAEARLQRLRELLIAEGLVVKE